jgi:hypothetical protein
MQRGPARRHGRDLRVGGPAEGRRNASQIEQAGVEGGENRGDDQDAENDGNPVLGKPAARRATHARMLLSQRGIGDCLALHGASLRVACAGFGIIC